MRFGKTMTVIKRGVDTENEARKYFLTVLAAGNAIADDNTQSYSCKIDRQPVMVFIRHPPMRRRSRSQPGPAEYSHPLCILSPSNRKSTIGNITVWSSRRFANPYTMLKGSTSCSKHSWMSEKLLHSIGWVHRDISGDNVSRSSEMSKLADPEHAKRIDSSVAHEVRTGTLGFMASEVEAQGYLFAPVTVKAPGEDRNSLFKFNPLHDMESLWWIATWTLYYRVDQKGCRPSSEQIKQFYQLFPGRLESARFATFSTALEYEVLPASFQRAGYGVALMHAAIVAAHKESEMTEPPDYANPLEKLNSAFAERLASAFAVSKNIEIFSPNAKRQREDPPSDTRDPKQPKV
ncbi:hypothetical protein EDD15DRAFT_2438059 [Pisolithus albus]|nr:hypothetical protein EDD15DRAFT_2438059 [Pisolithus albus]